MRKPKMFKVSTTSTFHDKILESHLRTNAAGLVWIPGTEIFDSSVTAPLVEVLAGLVSLTCRTGSLCTSLSGLVSGFTFTDGSLTGFRNCLFLLNVVPPD